MQPPLFCAGLGVCGIQVMAAVRGGNMAAPLIPLHCLVKDFGQPGLEESLVGQIHSDEDQHQRKDPPQRFQSRISGGRFEPAMGEATISGAAIETDDATGLAVAIEPLRLGGVLRPMEPEMWLE